MSCILIHGLGQNSSSWDKTVSFMPRTSDILCPDLFAALDNKEPRYADLYRAFSDYCNEIPGSLNLCGLSLGATLALNYIAEHPERVSSLALIGAQYKIPKALIKLQNIIFRLMPESMFISIGLKKKDVIDLSNSMIGLDFSEKLKDISCDALIICGAKDNANKKASRELAEKIPSAKLRFIENSGHMVNIDAPEKLAEIFNSFWKNEI